MVASRRLIIDIELEFAEDATDEDIKRAVAAYVKAVDAWHRCVTGSGMELESVEVSKSECGAEDSNG